ncbi:MAG: DNA polymerase III subunit delta [Chloroflexota bacterium]|nr:DNA polymerase III subunit delta [Chloroflexota bacterium]
MYYIFHGEDEFSRTEQVNKFRAQMGDPQFADLNTAWFDGRKVSLGELQHACDAVPFLADKRLVIVEGMLARFEPRRTKGGADDAGAETEEEANPVLAKDLKEYLTRLPEMTRLVFVETKSLAKNNPILKHAEGEKGKAVVKEFAEPNARALPKWIQDRAKAKGGTIDAAAVAELAAHVGADLRLLDTEIDKLMTYRRGQTIRPEDVRALVASVQEADVFALVDALGHRETGAALQLLHAQLDHNAAPMYLMSMIVRQFRMLLQMKDLAARGLTLTAAREQLKLHPFVAEKTWNQALNFTLPQLDTTYQKLLDTDIAIKTGRSEPVVALDVLIMELTR